MVAALLGGFLYKTSEQLVSQSQRVVEESKKVSDVVRMNIQKDPEYGENPELTAAFTAGARAQDERIEAQQAALASSQRTMLVSLVLGLLFMVIAIGFLGIYVTHKVAGPVFKMRRLLRQVGEGKLRFSETLRRGDELRDFFKEFSRMTEKLRSRKERELGALESAIEQGRAAGIAESALADAFAVRDEMKRSLEV